MKKPTLGESSLRAREKEDTTLDPREQGQWMSENFVKELFATVERGKKALPHQDFFVVVLQKRERLLTNVLRNYFIYRVSCPTPNYDQIVWRYDYKDENLELIWTLPDRNICLMILENASFLDPDLYGLLKYITDFKDGDLARLAMKLNKEEDLINNLTIQIK